MGDKMTYKQIRSKFIKEKIKGLEWNKKNKEYIDNLVFIEEYILEKVGGMGCAYRIHSLKDDYKKEYESICKELDPKEFKRMKKEEAREKKEEVKINKKLKQEEQKESQKARKEWVEMGGK